MLSLRGRGPVHSVPAGDISKSEIRVRKSEIKVRVIKSETRVRVSKSEISRSLYGFLKVLN